MRIGSIVMVSALLLPLGALGQPADVTAEIEATPGSPIAFYGHIFALGRGSPMPMNTQYPVGEDDYSRGVFGGCGSLAGVPVGMTGPVGGTAGPCEDWTENEVWFYTTAGFVQVKGPDEWQGYDQFHNERGQTKDIFFDTTLPANATLWMSADWHGWSSAFSPFGLGWNWDPGVFQDWVVEATVYHASLGDWSGDPSAAPNVAEIPGGSAATVVAYGRTDPIDMVSFDPTIPFPMCEGECRTVQPFDVPLTWDPTFDGRVPYLNDLVVRFQWYQETDGDRYIMTPGYFVALAWNLNAGEDFPPSITLPVRNPMDVELVFPRFVHDKLVVLSIINTPWGSYDIDPELTRLRIEDAAGNPVAVRPDTLVASVDASVAHSGHYKPINATWVWDYQEQGLPPGDYSAIVEVTNFQHSYSTSTAATFTVDEAGKGAGASAGRSGLASYTQEDFEAFNRGAGGTAAGGQGADADAQTSGGAESGSSAQKESPGVGSLLVVGLLFVGAVVRRRV